MMSPQPPEAGPGAATLPEPEPPGADAPYLTAALLCERVLIEKDDVVSAIRVIDQIALTLGGPDAPTEMPTVPLTVTAFVAFKSGPYVGPATVRIDRVSPSGKRGAGPPTEVVFNGQEQGTNLVFGIEVVTDEPGLHWFDVVFNDRVVTRIPLRLVYQAPSPREAP